MIEKIKNILAGTGLPVTYSAWPEGKAPQMPYICFLTVGSHNFAADGIAYSSAHRVQIELYTEKIDEASEKKITDALDAAGIFWESDYTYIDTEKCYETIYEIEV